MHVISYVEIIGSWLMVETKHSKSNDLVLEGNSLFYTTTADSTSNMLIVDLEPVVRDTYNHSDQVKHNHLSPTDFDLCIYVINSIANRMNCHSDHDSNLTPPLNLKSSTLSCRLETRTRHQHNR